MGSWNGTCAISNLHITAGTDVAVFMLLKNKSENSFCYGNALYTPCIIPFYGKYDDYGGVEDCEGPMLPLVIETIRDNLFEFEQGDNQYHDVPVKKADFNVEKLFEADHEDRLGLFSVDHFGAMMAKMEIDDFSKQEKLTDAEQTKLDMLYARLAQPQDTFQRLTHVIIHGQVFKDICEKHFFEKYVGDGKGDKGYDNAYKHLYLKDYYADIPAYIERVKEAFKDPLNPRFRSLSRIFEWNDENSVGQVMGHLCSNSERQFGLVDIEDVVQEYVGNSDWDGLAAFTKEAITGYWINMFMMETRKLWTKQTGAGSQNAELTPYRLLINSMNDIIKGEQSEWDEANDEAEEIIAEGAEVE